MDELRSDEKINEDAYVLEERRYYLDLQRSKRERARVELRERTLAKNTEFNKELTDDKQVQVANWEEIIETMGYTIVRNKLFQELHNFTIYHGSRTIPPMQPCLVKVFLGKDHKKAYNTKPIERLVKVILGLRSDRIVKLLGAIEVKQTEKIYFFEELTKMSLQCYFKANKQPLDPIRAKTWLCELASGVLYLHSHGFAHQKISLDWCYVKSDGEGIKLGCPDGLAEQVTYDLLKAYSKWSEVPPIAKKHQYNSYDALYGDPKTHDSLAADVWALGVMLYFFLTLKFPFSNWKSKKEMTTEVQCKRWSFIGMMDINPKLDEDTKVFLSKIFVSSPEARLTIHEVICDPYLYKKLDDVSPPPSPPPLPVPVPVPPAVRTELELEHDWAHNERLAKINNLKAFLDGYTERYRYKRFQPFLNQVNQHSLTSKEFEKASYEEGMQGVRLLRTNLVYQANEAQLYEGSVDDAECYVKVESLANFTKKYHVNELYCHLKKCYELKNPDKFIQLIKCYTVQNKIYLFINANKSMQRLSEKFQEDQPIDGTTARAWARQLIESIHFLHAKGLALPYLDPEYIFIKNGSLIIGQTESLYSIFSFDELNGSKVTYPSKSIIKLPHSAPESMYTEGTFDPFAADVWTVAAIMYNLLFLRAPFDVKIKKVYLEQVEQKRWLHVFDKKYKLDNDFFSFFDSIFIENPENRPLTIELLFSSLMRPASA